MVISQYLGRGAVSRGRMIISQGLNTVVSIVPYLSNNNDLEAVIQSLENVARTLTSRVPSLKIEWPVSGTSIRDHVKNVSQLHIMDPELALIVE
jgi:cellobiose dehydrogenase (acceptor)